MKMEDQTKKSKKSSPASKASKYIFHAKIVKGFVAKVLIDVLFTPLERGRFVVTNEGITIRENDFNNTILFDVFIPRGNLQDYICSDSGSEPVKFSVNLKHTQKILKNVKKKDSVTLCIKKGSDKLGVTILPEGSKKSRRSETGYVPFKLEPGYKIVQLPDIGYNYPVVVEAADFQKIKRLLSNNKTLTIKVIENKYITFKSDACGLLGSTLRYGDKDSVTEDDQVYKEEFKSLTIGHLIKVPGFCGQMQFSSPKEPAHPIKITADMSQSNVVIGKMEIYIKHVRQIDYERTLEENREDGSLSLIESPEDEDKPKKVPRGLPEGGPRRGRKTESDEEDKPKKHLKGKKIHIEKNIKHRPSKKRSPNPEDEDPISHNKTREKKTPSPRKRRQSKAEK